MLRSHACLRLVARTDRRELHGADGVVVNDLDLVTAASEPFQVRVCERCGVDGCEPSHWYVARRAADAVVWLPHTKELSPPAEPQVFTGEAVETLLTAVRGHPRLGELPTLHLEDAAGLVRDAAPGAAFGREGEAPALRVDLIVAVDGATLEEVVAQLQALAVACGLWRAPPPDARPIDLYLDLPGTPAWTPLARTAVGEWFVLALGASTPRVP